MPPTSTLNPRPATPSTWRHTPQRVFLRRALFQLHLWTGLILAAYAIVIGLTGSALIFKAELLERLQPALYTIHPVPRQTTLDAAVHAIESSHPGWTAFALQNFAPQNPDHPTQATDLLLRRTTGAPTPNYRIVSFNPYTGQVLLDRLRYAGLLGFLSNLHVYLLSGETGLLISGWMALGLLILSLSGLILWWPGVQRWAAALLLHRRTSWRRTNFDLHTVLGFWSSAAFLLVIVTGLDFAFPNPSGKLLELATLHGYRDTGVSLQPTIPTSPSPVLTLDGIIAAADRALPPDAPPGYLQLPSTPTSPFRVTGYYQHAAPFSQLVRIVLDPHTGALLASSDTRDQDLATRIEQYAVALHFGLFGGPGLLGLCVKILWVLLGLLPALLAVTGILMYWNRKLRPLWHRLRPSPTQP
jgi:uncharacterized iron-regulated membrane protein